MLDKPACAAACSHAGTAGHRWWLTAGVRQHDAVPRASLWALEELRQEVAKVDWERELKRKVCLAGLLRCFAAWAVACSPTGLITRAAVSWCAPDCMRLSSQHAPWPTPPEA